MPYCCQCGKQVAGADQFCGVCGAAQTSAPRPPAAPAFGADISNKNASLLCYIPWMGWIAAALVIASPRFKRDTAEAREVRFHAFQGLYLFVAWLIVDWVLAPMMTFNWEGMGRVFPRPVGGLLHVAIVATWIMMIVKVNRGEHYRLPLIGDLAERAVNEQLG